MRTYAHLSFDHRPAPTAATHSVDTLGLRKLSEPYVSYVAGLSL